jgi:hypothetical protein
VTRISHTELSTAQQDFSSWWRARQASAGGGRRLGYAQVVKLAVYKFHSLQGDRAGSLGHFDRLVARRLTNASRIARARLQLEAYIEWAERSGLIVADHRVRLNLPLATDVALGGEVSRIDIGRRGYRAVLLGARFSAHWKEEIRMPLIQLAVATEYARPPEDVKVAVQLLDGSGLDETGYDAEERNQALTAAVSVARRVRRMLARPSR